MARRRVSNPLALAVLSCLIERPMHPYEISTTLRERGKEHSIKLNYGSLYSVVESLQKHGLITAQETTRAGRRPERTVYAITDSGRAEFEDWLSELLSTPVREYTSLEAGLSLIGGLPPDVVADLLDTRVEKLRAEVGTVEGMLAGAREQGVPDLFLIESVFRVRMLRAEEEFVTQLSRDIRSSALPGTKAWGRVHQLIAAGTSFEEISADPLRYLGEEGRVLLPPEQPN
ncbi:MAG TPA: PadR family transcriptional regulator [Jatrophihabitantaceae bacterium]|jgi:DNA-binding PadR family transcriptional regulator|nr:PadR family transcriptional regulator [Jatrophihabitantaceae bacterium]